jgi:hypothetical protein
LRSAAARGDADVSGSPSVAWRRRRSRHDPRTFIAQLGAAYRGSGRTTRIFDTFGHNPYPASSSEPPYAEHPGSRILGQADYGALIDALTTAFAGTAQPVPGHGGVSVWYLEDGFQTAVPAGRRDRYTGRERASVVPALPKANARDQASQLRDALELAYCQPAIGAFFNFQLVDERGLGGWQSGLLWADSARKPSYARFRRAVEAVGDRRVDCSRFPPSALGAESAAPLPTLPLLSSPACCGQSSSTSISRSPGPDPTSAPTATAPSASGTGSTSTRRATTRRESRPWPR